MKNRIISIAMALVALFGVSLTVTAAQSSVINLAGNEVVELHCDGRRLVLDRTSKTQVMATCRPNKDATTPTATPVPPDDPAPTDTPEPEPTDPPSSSAPLCEDHDPIAWHSLYDAERNCHYNHTHNGNPYDLDHIFGPVGAWHNGQSISYPWHTPNENEIKHEGYKWEAKEIDGCLYRDDLDDTCVTAWRIQFHSLGGPVAATARLHSYSAEIRVCTEDGSQCGIVRTGGWADFGILEVPYKGEHVPLPGDPDAPPGGFNVHVPPYRGHSTLDGIDQGHQSVPVTWNSSSRYGYNQILEFDFKAFDDWQGIDPNDPGRFEFICPDYQCKFNHSQIGIYEILVKDKLPADSKGLVNFTGYTDRKGNIVEGCTEIGLDCIPLIFENVPTGQAAMRILPKDSSIEYDLSPAGEWWIEYPN